MKRQISIREGSVDKAAAWIILNNKHLHNPSYQYIIEQIQGSIDRVVKHANLYWELNYSSTAGFTVFFMPEDENYGTVEILVDPCVSSSEEIKYVYVN